MGAKSLTFLVIVMLLLALPAGARADIADTFNMKELARSYSMSCEEQAARRHANLAPPYFPGRPREFLNPSDALVIYSPHLTAEQRETAEKLVASLPVYALPIAWRGGAVYVFARRSIVEAVPALAVERDWFGDFGLYMEVERRLYIPFEKGEGLRRKSDGAYAARRFVPSRREPFRIINHETGHMIDNMLGEYSLDSKGEDGKFRLSNRPDYLAAVKADLARLASGRGPVTLARVHKLGYYMPRSFDGVRLGIQTDQRARREVFAELWAEVQGHNSNRLYEAYPDTFKVVKAYADFLKAQDAAAPRRCAF
jgi:hypothetical protein